TERLERTELLDSRELKGAADLNIDVQRRTRRRAKGFGARCEGLAKGVDTAWFETNTDRSLMASKADEIFGAVQECAVDIEGARASSATDGDPLFISKHDGRDTEAIGEARSDDPEDPRMIALA